MAFCASCGTQMADNAAFCPNCGKAAAPAMAELLSLAPPAQPAGYASAGAPAVPLEENIAGMLAYFTIIPAIIFLLSRSLQSQSFRPLPLVSVPVYGWGSHRAARCAVDRQLRFAADDVPHLGTSGTGGTCPLDTAGDQGLSARDVQAAHRRRPGGETGERLKFITSRKFAGPSCPLLISHSPALNHWQSDPPLLFASQIISIYSLSPGTRYPVRLVSRRSMQGSGKGL